MYIYAYSIVKVVFLSNEAYNFLKSKKESNESFSDVIIRLKSRDIIEILDVLKKIKNL